jgi:exopolysaccharide biosynthesis polyprenyl glycosylphosphotransferase
MTLLEEAAPSVLPSVPKNNIGRKLQALVAVTVVADAGAAVASVALAALLRNNLPFWGEDTAPLAWTAVPVLVAGWLLVLAVQGAYSPRRFGAGPDEFRAVVTASVIAGGLAGACCYVTQTPLSRGFFVLAFGLGTPALLMGRSLLRLALHEVRRRGRLAHRVLAVGGPSGVAEVVDALERDKQVGYSVVGACLPGGAAYEPHQFAVPLVGDVSETRRLCEAWDVDTVLVTRGGYASAQDLRQIAWDLEGSPVALVVAPSLTDVAGPRIHMRPVAGLPLVHVEQPQAGKAGGMSKRMFDVVLAAGALVLLSPLMLVIALAVKLEGGGTVFFHQQRVGRGGQPFGMIKFRSMVPDAERRLADVSELNDSGGVLFKIRRDPRVTRVGGFLRRYSLDEVPQLLNILRGDMSLVGPRPPLRSEVDNYADDVHRRLLVRPGLTGLWQVSGRSNLSWDESVRLDLFYVDNWSMTSDLAIMAKTVRAVLLKDGAY